MKKILEIEKLNSAQRWSWVLGALFAATVVCYEVAQKDSNLFSAFFVYYLPLGLSAMLLGLNATAVLTLIVFVLSLLNFLSSSFPAWAFVTFLAGLVVNYYFWHHWSQEKELKEFQYQKAK